MDETTEGFFCDLMDLPLGERLKALDLMTELSAEQKAEIRLMLAEAEQAEAYFTGTSMAAKIVPCSMRVEQQGEMCGPYRLIRKLGEGGFGLVWVAEQEHPLKRTVAVKVIKAGMDTAEVLARFDAEKQALARMDHPNIAKVLDAGMTESGRPYFVMEMVEGAPITRYCEEKTLDLPQRLRLFVDVCSALHHAHQKGVIHRDIKPSNVLVSLIDGKAVAKVIDFGIAKAINDPLTDHTLLTRVEQWIGTPTYMSPEQANMGAVDVDTRSDIYSLGVLLYELIAGAPPFDSSTLMKAGYEEMRRIIREVEPLRPSQRIATALRQKSDRDMKHSTVTMKSSVKTACSELDWIVVKAMEKARERRYESAFALACDIERFLSDQPVEARPPSRWYLISKFARRHRATMLVSLTLLALLIATVVFSTWQAVRANRAAEEARNAEQLAQARLLEAEAARTEKDVALQDSQAITRLLFEVFRRPDPEFDGRKVTVAAALDAATKKLDEELKFQPERQAMLLGVLAETYEKLGIMDKAIELRRKVLKLHQAAGEKSRTSYLDALEILLSRLHHVGKYTEARDMAQQELAILENQHGMKDERTLRMLDILALNIFRTGDYAKAINLQIQLTRHLSETVTQDHRRVLAAAERVLDFARDSGENEEIEEFHREFKAILTSKKGQSTPFLNSEDQQSKLNQARQKAERLASELGLIHHQTIEARLELATLLHQARRYDAAVDLLVMIIRETSELYGESHPRTLAVIETCENAAVDACRWDVSNQMRSMATVIREQTFGLEHVEALRFYMKRIFSAFLAQRPEEGIELAEAHMEEARRVLAPKSYHFLEYLCSYARCLAAEGRTQDAIKVLEEICPDMFFNTYVHKLYGGLLLWNHREAEYETLRKRLIAYYHTHRHGYRGRGYNLEKIVLSVAMRPFQNEEQMKKVAEILEITVEMFDSDEIYGTMFYTPWQSHTSFGIGYYRLGKYQLALEHFDKAEKRFKEAERHGEETGKPLRLIRGVGTSVWHSQIRLIYRPLILNAMGKTDEARKMFIENLPKIERCQDEAEPLKGEIEPDGIRIMQYLALREASEIFDLEIPKNQR